MKNLAYKAVVISKKHDKLHYGQTVNVLSRLSNDGMCRIIPDGDTKIYKMRMKQCLNTYRIHDFPCVNVLLSWGESED
jgi:hypothetical protein